MSGRGEFDDGVQRDLDVGDLLCGDVHEVAQDTPHHSL